VDENIHLINLLSEFDSLIGQNKLILSSFNYGLGHDEVEKLLKTEQDRLAKSASEYAGRYKKKGDKFYEDKNYNKAIEMYSKAIEMDGDMYSAFNRRGNCYYVLEDYAKALSDFDWSTNIKRDYSIAYYNKGNCLRKLKHYK
jgi:tetratricopeptide (TPR) repeat protein